MKKMMTLVVAFFLGCMTVPVGNNFCKNNEECPADYVCRDRVCKFFSDSGVLTPADAGVQDTPVVGVDADNRDNFVVHVDASLPDTSMADVILADAGIQDMFVSDTASLPDTFVGVDASLRDTSMADVILADAGIQDAFVSDIAVWEDTFVGVDAGSPDTMGECNRNDQCVSLYGAEHYCWDTQCVLANSTACGPFQATVYKATGYDMVRIRAYGTSGFIREFSVDNGTYTSEPGECSWLIFEVDGAFGGCKTVFGQSSLECSTSSCPPDGFRCRWDQ